MALDQAAIGGGEHVSFEEARAAFPVLEGLAYLNAGTFGPLARATAAAMREELERDLAEGRSGTQYFPRVLDLRAQVRARLAALVGVEPDRVALTSSTTDGCNIVLAGLGLGPGDEVVTTTDEHFGLLGALAASPARVVVADPEPDRILAAVTPRTRLLALSHVLWTTGAMLPVLALRERSGLPVLVDGAQSVGAVPVGAATADFLTISCQKWLCGPDATGALVISDPERLRVASPSHFSQSSYELDGSFLPRDGAARFDPNWWPTASLAGLLAALDSRPAWAYERARATADALRERLAPRVELATPPERSTLVAFRPDEEPAAVVERLAAAGVVVRDIPGRGLVRVSVGYWTSDGDLERLLAEL